MAYLLSQYPAISHTFFLQEVLGLRARGLHIQTASINPPDRPMHKLPPREAAEAATTHYIKGTGKASALATLLRTAITRPAVVLRGVAAVCRVPRLTLRQRLFWFFYLAEAILVGDWMRTRSLNHLHVHFGGPVASVGMLTSIAWRLPFSLTIHGPEELLNVDANHLREKLEQASYVLCISDFCRSQLCQLTPAATWSKFSVMRLGVDPVVLTPVPQEPGERTLRLVCTGRLVAAKGHHILLQALHLVQQRGSAIHATLIGAGPERESLEQYVLSHSMTETVTFTSSLSHPETLDRLRGADAFALASFAEGIPVAIMEAMSLGLPCISTTIAGIPELIESGVDGLLVPPSNVEALADALESLATDPARRRLLGEAARRKIIRAYNLPLNQERLAHAFEQRFNAASAEARSAR